MGVADADAQKRKTKRVVKTQQTIRNKQKLPVDSVVIFAYWDEHGMETTGVQLRRKGNQYLLSVALTEVIRITLQEGLDFSRKRTEERIANGWFDDEMRTADSICICKVPGLEMKVSKAVADKVAEMASEGYTKPLERYYTTEEEERLTGGSWWNMEMQLPGKEKVVSGGRNNNGPAWVFKVYDYLFTQKVKNKWKVKRY